MWCIEGIVAYIEFSFVCPAEELIQCMKKIGVNTEGNIVIDVMEDKFCVYIVG